MVKGETVCEFTGTYAKNLTGVVFDYLQDVVEPFLIVDENSKVGLVKIGLKDAVTAIKRAVCCQIEDLISTTDIVSGPWTGLEEATLMGQEMKCPFTHVCFTGMFN